MTIYGVETWHACFAKKVIYYNDKDKAQKEYEKFVGIGFCARVVVCDFIDGILQATDNIICQHTKITYRHAPEEEGYCEDDE